MHKKVILVFMIIVLISFLCCGKRAETDDRPVIFQYAHSQSDSHPRSQSMMYFKDLLENETGNRIKMEFYFDGVLGKEAEVLDMVKTGNIDGYRGGLFAAANRLFLVYTLPFMFETTDQVLKVMSSDFGKKINEGAMANGFYIPVTGLAGGFRNITNNVRPIKSVLDIKGLKMRTPPIEMTLKTFAALGAAPQEIAYNETGIALKNGVVDGQENPFSNIVDMKFYENQRYLSVVNWQVHPDPLFVNPNWYAALPDDLKEIFNSVAIKAMDYSNKIWLGSEREYYEILKKHLKVNVLDAEARKGFIDAVQPVWESYVDDGIFTWDEIHTVLKIASE